MVKRNGIGNIGEGTAKGAQHLPTPYTTKVASSRPELKLLVEQFKQEAKLYQELLRKKPARNAYQFQMTKVMGVWEDIVRMAYWTTGSGKRAYEVMGNELYRQIKHGLVWDDYEATEDGDSGTFTSVEEQLAASVLKVYKQAKGMGIANAQRYTVDELSLMMQQKTVYDMVDRLEREYDKELLRNPKLGTIREMGRRKRTAEEFVEAMGRAMNKIRDGKASAEYTQSILGFMVRTMEATRMIVLNWSKKDMSPRLQRTIQKAKKTHARMHLVYVANNLLDMLQEIGLYTNLQMLQEYSAAKAKGKHKASSWAKKPEAEKDLMVGAIEYKDITSKEDQLDPEQETLVMEDEMIEELGEDETVFH